MKALIIDDEPLIRRSLSRALSMSGHQVIEASDGSVGMNLWIKENPNLVFLDILMPGLTGPQVLQAMPKEILDKTKIILMSAYTGEEENYTKDYVFLSKPFEDIFKIVRLAEGLLEKG